MLVKCYCSEISNEYIEYDPLLGPKSVAKLSFTCEDLTGEQLKQVIEEAQKTRCIELNVETNERR